MRSKSDAAFMLRKNKTPGLVQREKQEEVKPKA